VNLPLFDIPPAFDRAGLATHLRNLAGKGIWIGTSSWKYEGWLGQIYTRDLYTYRGRFSPRKFQEICLAEYSETFPIVCGDFSFYQFPKPEFWRKLFASAPPSLRFALKVPEEVTAEEFPKHARYGARAGSRNDCYLNADAVRAQFIEPLQPFASRIAALIFEFGARGASTQRFVSGLDLMLGQLPHIFRYAVEVRNRQYLQPRYFECLRSHGVAHVLNSWTRMPLLSEQMALEDVFTTDFTVVRALLRPGRNYSDAVGKFQPYSEVREENPEVRGSLRGLIQRMQEERRGAYIFVNNRLEGNAPETIRAVVEG
jgi:uncharacterized protein YecE (DUF72 family)